MAANGSVIIIITVIVIMMMIIIMAEENVFITCRLFFKSNMCLDCW